MISFEKIPKVYIACGPTDLRKGIDGYAHIIQDTFKLSPFQDALFIFCNRSRTMIKCLYWDKSGFWLLHKRLEEGRFKWEKSSDGLCMEISHRQLQWILEGLKIHQKSAFKEQDPKYV